MAPTTSLLTWEDFAALPQDDMHHELIEGEHQALPAVKSRQAFIARMCWKYLFPMQECAHICAFAEAGFRLPGELPTWIQPDVSVLTRERMTSTPLDEDYYYAPELAVEVFSQSEKPRDLQRKIELLLASGSLAVWVIYPKTQTVKVHLPNGKTYTRGVDESLTFPELLPDWQLPVAKIFEE
jgi:Uma2 family endonuclease